MSSKDPLDAGLGRSVEAEPSEWDGGELDFSQEMDAPAAPPAGVDAQAAPLATQAAPQPLPATGLGEVRDRIVILGRRAAGKTIFLSRLYRELWHSKGDLSMRALSGQAHRVCMETIEQMEKGRWPASTLGSTYVDLEITFRGQKQLLVALDYPGEVFRRAFVDNLDAPDTRELVEHVDRASGVILLIDPAVAARGDYGEFIDDDYGMAQAIHRIREWPGGDQVPVAVVFTKCDVNKGLLREAGGVRAFCQQKYVGLLRSIGSFRLFASAAVFAVPARGARLVPVVAKPPVGVIEPVRYCLEQIARQRAASMAQMRRAEAAQALSDAQRRAEEAQRRATVFWSVFVAVALLVLGVVGLATAKAVGLF